MHFLVALLGGITFGLGLAVSGMTDRNKVLNFLDLFGTWDPALMFVMGGALLVSVPGYFFVRKLQRPILSKQFFMPTNAQIDLRLIVGAALFGVGWGLYGYCPGPAIASIAYGKSETWVFVIAMTVGLMVPTLFRVSKK